MGGESDIKECPLISTAILSQVERLISVTGQLEQVCTDLKKGLGELKIEVAELKESNSDLKLEVALLKQKDTIDDKIAARAANKSDKKDSNKVAINIALGTAVLSLLTSIGNWIFNK